MKQTKIYFVQQKIVQGYDKAEDEPIEEDMVVGYFTTAKNVALVKEQCVANNIPLEQIYVKEIPIVLGNNQKYVYVLSHEYAIKHEDGSYTDYEYIFDAKRTKEECEELKTQLQQQDKFKYSTERIYDAQPQDGFLISKTELDCMWYPIFLRLRSK